MSSTESSNNSPKYWLSLDQWRQDPEFLAFAEHEFTSSPLRESDNGEGGWARREFLKLMGASMALASFGCMRRPEQKIVPYIHRPRDLIEGIPNYYASSFVDGSETFGTVVTTREGRPIHVTGNSMSPINGQGMSARAHAHVLSLYDPARLTGPIKNLQNDKKTNHDTIGVTWDAADKDIAAQIKKGKVAILTGSIVSPTMNHALSEFAKTSGAKVYTWDALSYESLVEAQELSYGTAVAPRLAVAKAKYILAVNNDFLGTWLQPTQQMREFGSRRKPGPDMNRLVVFESLMSLTGSNADQRYRIRPSDTTLVLMRLAHELLVTKKVSAYANDAQVTATVKGWAGESAGIRDAIYIKIAEELWANKGQSLVLGGSDLASQVAANLLNSILGNDGVTVDSRRSPNMGFQGRSKHLADLIEGLNNGSIKTVIIHGVNPAYAAAAKVGFVEGLKKAEMAIYTGDRNDETGRICDYILPDSHPMESWGDVEGQKGVFSVQQPTIEPLYKTRAFGDTLIAWSKELSPSSELGKATSFYTMVKANFETKLHANWVKTLQDGVVDSSASARQSSDSSRPFKSSALKSAEHKATPKSDLELVLYTTIGLRDGSMANVPWLQEFPDPITKICWDNYITVSPKFAEERKLKESQVAKMKVGDREISLPIHIQPGQDDNSLGLALGYGREKIGDVGSGVGVNAFALAPVVDGRPKFSGISATIEVTKIQDPLACTQGYYLMSGKTPEGINMGARQIVVEATLEQFKENPGANIERTQLITAWTPHKYEGHKWGMSVDLSVCTGCSACVVACQSENNIPTVGKTYVLSRREMHWMRVDRYFVGSPNEPDSVHIPVMCQHCDNAPCETVCPVAATVHSAEGTNDMIYNRCVGTRYCSNNCPYKVRRFNWFNYSRMNPQYTASPMHMQLNPEVTVRTRGVMEKCSFCTQRIQQVKTRAKLEERKVKDGEIQTACQASCPTNAITFGDTNDPDSRVSQLIKEQRYYGLLEELNTRPAVRYASKIRNTEALKGEHSEHKKVEDSQHEQHQGGHV